MKVIKIIARDGWTNTNETFTYREYRENDYPTMSFNELLASVNRYFNRLNNSYDTAGIRPVKVEIETI